MTSFDIVFGLGWTILFLSLISSIIVIILVMKQYRKEGQISMAHRFPLYIAITDIGLSMSLLSNQFHSVLYRETLQGDWCKALSVMIALTGSANMGVVTSIAVLSYLRVCRSIDCQTGKYDWKLHVIVMTNAIFWSNLGLPSFGPSKYWCYQEINSQYKAAGILVIVVNTVLFGTTTLCFFAVLQKLQQFSIKNRKLKQNYNKNSVQKSHSISKSSQEFSKSVNALDQASISDQFTEIESRAVRKILLHIVSFFVQWSSTIPYCFGGIIDYNEDWTYILCTAGMNLGGIMNLTAYLINSRK